MPVIDKSMYENLKNWCDKNRPEHQYMMYVNSCDRGLTDATVRKLMSDIEEEDIDCEEFISYYSAKSFFNNMREYFSHVAKLYLQKPDDDASINDIIKSVPSTCGWITLIIAGVEALSGEEEITEEMFKSLLSFACKRANIILIGNGDYKEAFSGSEFVLRKMADGTAAKQEDNLLMIGLYDQEETPEKECIAYDTEKERCRELCFYWNTVYNQLENGYFDYNYFKVLVKETLEYFIPRVTKEQVYRRDLWLIEKIGAMHSVKDDIIDGCKVRDNIVDGCKPWEFDASREVATGLLGAIVYNDDFSSGNISLDVRIKLPDKGYSTIYTGGYMDATIPLSVDTVYSKIDSLAEAIRDCTYEKNERVLFNIIDELEENDDME